MLPLTAASYILAGTPGSNRPGSMSLSSCNIWSLDAASFSNTLRGALLPALMALKSAVSALRPNTKSRAWAPNLGANILPNLLVLNASVNSPAGVRNGRPFACTVLPSGPSLLSKAVLIGRSTCRSTVRNCFVLRSPASPNLNASSATPLAARTTGVALAAASARGSTSRAVNTGLRSSSLTLPSARLPAMNVPGRRRTPGA